MTPPTDPETRQEAQYELPYHHVPRFLDGRFSQGLVIPWGYTYQASLEFLLDLLATRDFGSLLDVGCGDGRLLTELAAWMPEVRLTGIDTSQRAVAMARAFCPKARVHCGDLTDETLARQHFDAITLLEVLEHIPENQCDAFLRDLRPRLTPGGFLLLSVPSDNVPVSAKHYRHFNADSLAAALEPYFRIEEIHYLARRSIWNRLLRWALWNRFYAITSPALSHRVYGYYRRRLLHAQAGNAGKICAICRPE